MSRIVLCVAVIALVVTGCSTLTPQQHAYAKHLDSVQTQFSVSRNAVADLRGHAQVWITRFSTMKIQTVTDYVINTFNPGEGQFGYTLTFEPAADSVNVTVDCIYKTTGTYDFLTAGHAIVNRAILADYLQTGLNPYPELISR